METISLRITFLLTYFVALFGFRICKETLIDSNCVSSISFFNLIVTFLSWIILSFLKNSSRLSTSPPVTQNAKVITGFLQTLHFIFLAKSISVNTFSVHRFASLLTVPYSILFSYIFLRRKFSFYLLLSITIFLIGACMISTDSFLVSSVGISTGITYALLNAHLALFIEKVIVESGTSAINFQQSASVYRLLFSLLVSIIDFGINQPKVEISFRLTTYPICLIFAAAGLDLAQTVSMTSIISSTSAISFLVAEQFCELLMILIGHTLNPTNFTTFQEAIFSFIGFFLALPGQLMFVINGNSNEVKGINSQPFRPFTNSEANPSNDTEALID